MIELASWPQIIKADWHSLGPGFDFVSFLASIDSDSEE